MNKEYKDAIEKAKQEYLEEMNRIMNILEDIVQKLSNDFEEKRKELIINTGDKKFDNFWNQKVFPLIFKTRSVLSKFTFIHWPYFWIKALTPIVFLFMRITITIIWYCR